MTKKGIYTMAIICAVFLFAGCLPGPNTAVCMVSARGTIAGFWLGLWHGMIAPVTLIISLFYESVHMYEMYNNGGWYNFGFVLGIVILSAMSLKASS